MTPWKLPLIVAAIALPIAATFLVGGPGVGVAIGALAALVLLVVAARQRPRGPIVSAVAEDGRRHVLLVVTCPLEEPVAVRQIVHEARLDGSGDDADDAEVLVLAPAEIGFLDRWASDVEGARHRAQQNLVTTVAALAKAGIAAEARVGDEDVVQAVEDQLQSFPADEVILVSAQADEEGDRDAAAAELGSRLEAEFSHVVLRSGGR
jgi:hypothetical protein